MRKCRIVPSITDCTETEHLVLDDPTSTRICQKCNGPVSNKAEAPKLPCVDLYSGGGGTVLGAHHYFEHIMAVDFEENAVKTLR